MLRVRFGGPGIAILILLGPAGCASLDNVYLHDPQLNEAATAAAAAFDDARPDELWQTMLNNVKASAEIEQEILAKSAEQRFEGKLTNLENLTWKDLRRCGEGACWSDYQAEGFPKLGDLPLETTQDKLVFLQTQIEDLSAQAKNLEQHIRSHVPVEAGSQLHISSTLTRNIERAEAKIQAAHNQLETLKNDALNTIQEKLDELSAPLMDPFPNQRAQFKESIDLAFEDVQGILEDARGLIDLQTSLREDFIDAVEFNLIDAGIDVDESEQTRELFDNAVALFLEKSTGLLNADQLLNSFRQIQGQLNFEIVATESAIGRLQMDLDTALGDSATPSERVRAINDVFNKTEHPALLKLESFEEILQGGLTDSLRVRMDEQLNIGNAFANFQNSDVSSDFIDGLEADIGGSICEQKPCQVKHIIEFLKNDNSRLEVIRRSMLAEFRGSELAIYRQQLRSLKDEISITKKLAATLDEQLRQQGVLAFKVGRQIEAQRIGEDQTVYHGLDCLARSAGRTHGAKCAADTKTARDHFSETLNILIAYYSLNGYIKDQEQQQWVALARHRHQASIAESQLAARSREQLIANGLDGLVAFTNGGITAEQIAGTFRLLNSTLLAIIAGDI